MIFKKIIAFLEPIRMLSCKATKRSKSHRVTLRRGKKQDLFHPWKSGHARAHTHWAAGAYTGKEKCAKMHWRLRD